MIKIEDRVTFKEAMALMGFKSRNALQYWIAKKKLRKYKDNGSVYFDIENIKELKRQLTY